MWNPSPPQGFSKSQSQVIIGRSPIPLFGAPQGIGDAAPIGDNILALFPTIGDIDYANYKFYQVNKGQASGVQTNMPLLIIDTLPDNTLLEPSGFDIRAFASTGRTLSQAKSTGNTFNPQFDTTATQWSDDGLHLFVWELNTTIHEYIVDTPFVLPPFGTPSDFTFSPSLEMNGRDIKFVDDGNKMLITGVTEMKIELFSLPSRNSFETTPILLQTFDPMVSTDDPRSCDMSVDGKNLYVLDQQIFIYQWRLSTPFTLPSGGTPADLVSDLSSGISGTNGNSRMSADGSAFYVMGVAPDVIVKWLTTTKYDIPTGIPIPDESFNVEAIDTNARTIHLSKDESFIWFTGRMTNIVHELFLPGVSLPYEVQSIDNLTGPPTIYVWVNVDTVKDSEFIQLTFGKIDATDASSDTTWDSDYKMVLHMEPDLLDSTSNGNDVDSDSGSGDVAGKISQARDFDGTDRLTVLDSPSLDITTAITISSWVNTMEMTSTWVLAKDSLGSAIRPYGIRHQNEHVRFAIDNGVFEILEGVTLVTQGIYAYMVGTYDGNTMKVYLNGELDGTFETTGNIRTNDDIVAIGRRGGATPSLIGDIDETRISSIARSADWIRTEFNNQNDNDTFWHKTPLLTNGEDNFLVDEQGRKIEVVGQ